MGKDSDFLGFFSNEKTPFGEDVWNFRRPSWCAAKSWPQIEKNICLKAWSVVSEAVKTLSFSMFSSFNRSTFVKLWRLRQVISVSRLLMSLLFHVFQVLLKYCWWLRNPAKTCFFQAPLLNHPLFHHCCLELCHGNHMYISRLSECKKLKKTGDTWWSCEKRCFTQVFFLSCEGFRCPLTQWQVTWSWQRISCQEVI